MYCRLGPPRRHEREPEQDLHVELDLLLWCSCQYVIKLQGKQSVNIYLHLPVRTVYISGGKGDILVCVCPKENIVALHFFPSPYCHECELHMGASRPNDVTVAMKGRWTI